MSRWRIAIRRERRYSGPRMRGWMVLAAWLALGCLHRQPHDAAVSPAAGGPQLSCPLPMIPWASSADRFDSRQTAQLVGELETAAKLEHEAFQAGQPESWSKATQRLLAQPRYHEYSISLAATHEAMKLRDLECALLIGRAASAAQTEEAFAEVLGGLQRLRKELLLWNPPPQVQGFEPRGDLVH
jgi:hypothetical protein